MLLVTIGYMVPQTDDTAIIIMNQYNEIYTCNVTGKVIFSLFATLQPVSLEIRKNVSSKVTQYINNTLVKKLDLS